MGLDVVDDRTTILIPAYNPDEKLLALLPRLRERFRHIVLVNDGSTTGKDVFERAVPLVDAILVHEKRMASSPTATDWFSASGRFRARFP